MHSYHPKAVISRDIWVLFAKRGSIVRGERPTKTCLCYKTSISHLSCRSHFLFSRKCSSWCRSLLLVARKYDWQRFLPRTRSSVFFRQTRSPSYATSTTLQFSLVLMRPSPASPLVHDTFHKMSFSQWTQTSRKECTEKSQIHTRLQNPATSHEPITLRGSSLTRWARRAQMPALPVVLD